jgi:hypothetical protein
VSNQFRRESAKIYQFPRKISGSGAGNRQIEKPGSDLRASRVAIVESGSGWYHEAAVQAERARKR